MAENKTNSNSITAILVTKLNNKKSGFRSKILSEWEIPDDTIFYDGTYTTLPFKEMGNAHVDIVGKSKSKVVIMIEVKANIKEELQETQTEDGAYQNTAKQNHIKLKYIIPEGYEHEINSSKNNIYCKIIKWSWIYEIAKEYDSTGFCNDIEYFVDNDFGTNDLLLTKSEVAMFLSPETIKKVSDLDFGFTSFMSVYVNPNNGIEWKGDERDLVDGLGWKYLLGEKEKKEIWIGFAEIEEDSKHSLFIYYYNKDAFTSETLCPNFTEGKDYYLKNDNYEIWVPIVDGKGEIPEFLYKDYKKDYNENRQNEFNSLMNFNLKRFLCILKEKHYKYKEEYNIKKYPENKKILSSKIIGAVSSLDYKIQTLLGNFIEDKKKNKNELSYENPQRTYEEKLGWKYKLKEKEIWIGINSSDEYKNQSFFFKDEEKLIPIVEENGNVPEFLFAENVEDQQNKFNDLVKNNIEKLLK